MDFYTRTVPERAASSAFSIGPGALPPPTYVQCLKFKNWIFSLKNDFFTCNCSKEQKRIETMQTGGEKGGEDLKGGEKGGEERRGERRGNLEG
jgi:hypothetical protein